VLRSCRSQLLLVPLLSLICCGTPAPIEPRDPPGAAVTSEVSVSDARTAVEEPLPVAPHEHPATLPVEAVVDEGPTVFVDRESGSTRTACQAVVTIGDSTSTGTIKSSWVKDPNDRLNAQYAKIGVQKSVAELSGARSMVEHSKPNENGVMVVKRLRKTGYQGCWVIALGINDTANVARGARVGRVERIERMMAVIGDDPVLWVDTVTRRSEGWYAAPNMQLWNEALAATLPSYPNARIYRWSEDVNESWFGKDKIHYTREGYTARARLIAEALAAAFPAE
jgi:lysophospholipase L1-like esterase